jgi:hypothetical protein
MLSFCFIREIKFFETLEKLLEYEDARILVFWFIIYFLVISNILFWIEGLFEKKENEI